MKGGEALTPEAQEVPLTGSNFSSVEVLWPQETSPEAPCWQEQPQRLAIFHGADLFRASFAKAEFPGADFSEATLNRTDFRGANLTGANLHGASMEHSRLDRAVVSGADFEGANFVRYGEDECVFGIPKVEPTGGLLPQCQRSVP